MKQLNNLRFKCFAKNDTLSKVMSAKTLLLKNM